MKLREIMTPDPRCVAPTDTLRDAACVMRDLDIGAVPICENNRLAGMLTDRDITVRAVAEGRDPNATRVRDAMSEGVVFAFDDQDVEEAAQVFKDQQIRRLPVLNRDKRLVGIIAFADLSVDASRRLGGEALREVSKPAEPARR